MFRQTLSRPSRLSPESIFPRFALTGLTFRGLALTTLAITGLALTACSSDSTDEAANEGGFSMPLQIRQSLVIDFSAVSGVVNLNGQTHQMERFGNRYRAEIPVNANSNATADLLFSELLPDGRILDLARTEPFTITIGGGNTTVELSEDQYIYDFDDDGDQISNIAERDANTDPFVPEVTINRNILVQFSLPAAVIDPDITRIIALIADVPRAFSRRGDLITVTGLTSSSTSVRIDIRLTQQIDSGASITVANAVQVNDAGTDDLIVVLSDDDFDFSVDSDGDGVSNIDEIQDGTDPFNPNSN